MTETRSRESPWREWFSQLSSHLHSSSVGIFPREGAVSVPSAICSASMNISAAFREKAQLSQFVPLNFSIVDRSFKVVASAMIWVCDCEALI